MDPCARTPGQQENEENEDGLGMDSIRKKLMFDLSPNETVLNHLHALKQPVQVYLRIRPKSSLEVKMKDPSCLYPVSETSLYAVAPHPCRLLKGYGKGPVEHWQSKRFFFSHIYDEDSTQSDIFKECVIPIIEDFFVGQNCLIFSYGVTNSGKSYTITGKHACVHVHQSSGML